MAQIGHASQDENSGAKGGQAGDQTKKEVFIQNWYNHPWNTVIRPKDSTIANKIASAMRAICANDNIGYDQSNRLSLYNEAKKLNWQFNKITTPCETDCSACVSVCVNAAGVKVSSSMYTGNEASLLNATGKFVLLTDSKYTSSPDNLQIGDILLAAGHTAIVVSAGNSKVSEVVVQQTTSSSVDSKLVSYVNLSPNKYGKRGRKIDSVAIHCMAGNLSVESCGILFSKSSRQASSNYGIDSEGKIGLYVPEDEAAWTTSNEGVDRRSITIEVANMPVEGKDSKGHTIQTMGEPYPISDKAYAALINLLVDICRRNKIDSLRWKADRAYALKAAAGGSVKEQNMFVHRWFSAKSCPGTYIYNAHKEIADEVNRRLKNKTPLKGIQDHYVVANGEDPTEQTAYTSNSSAQTIDKDALVRYVDINPYIAVIDRHTKTKLNFKKLRNQGVSGLLIEAGYLYDKSHKLVEFTSPKAKEQVDAAIKNKMPFGWYITTRAQTTREVDEEAKRLKNILNVYPPNIGVWVKLDLGTNVKLNDKIVGRYLSVLESFGLSRQIGIYLTKNQLQQTITWSKHQSNWYLFLIKHVKNTSKLQGILDPEFFDTSGGYK